MFLLKTAIRKGMLLMDRKDFCVGTSSLLCIFFAAREGREHHGKLIISVKPEEGSKRNKARLASFVEKREVLERQTLMWLF